MDVYDDLRWIRWYEIRSEGKNIGQWLAILLYSDEQTLVCDCVCISKLEITKLVSRPSS